MTTEILAVLAILITTIGLFIWDKIRMDLVAFMVITVLAVSGLVTPAEAVSGFGNTLVVMIAALFVVGEGLFRTGVAAQAGNFLLKVGGANETRLLFLMLAMVAGMSAFMSSTGAVALFIPIVLTLARKANLSPSRLMMPLAFGSLMGGMLTLIGTPPNMVVANLMKQAGLPPFQFFDFTPIGLSIFAVGSLYLVFVARYFLPKQEAQSQTNKLIHLSDMAQRYQVHDQLHRLVTLPNSSLLGKTVSEAALRTEFEVTVFGIKRHGRFVSTLMPVLSETRIYHRDHLLVYGAPSAIDRLCSAAGLIREGFPHGELNRVQQEFGAAEILMRRSSPMIGKTLKEARFRDRIGLSVIGIRRNNAPMAADFQNTRLEYGDSLLVVGGWQSIEELNQNPEFVVLETPLEMQDAPSHGQKAPWALAIVLSMLVLMVSGITSTLAACLIAAMAMILTGCVKLQEAYRSINVASLMLIAGMLPLAKAMEKSGALELFVDGLSTLAAGESPRVVLGGFFILTSLLSQFISNTATTVLLSPVAIASAQALGIAPAPILMTVALAASTAFSTPIASPVNTLVIAPGNYRFIDFVKVGVPLQLLTMVLILWLTPYFFPF